RALAGLAGGHHAILLERRLQLRHLFPGRRDAHPFVDLKFIAGAVLFYLDREDLPLKAAVLDRLPGLDVTLVGELVELLPAESPFLGDHLRRVALRDDLEEVHQLGADRALTRTE